MTARKPIRYGQELCDAYHGGLVPPLATVDFGRRVQDGIPSGGQYLCDLHARGLKGWRDTRRMAGAPVVLEKDPRTEAGKAMLGFVTVLIHPTDPPKPSVARAVAAIENEAVALDRAELAEQVRTMHDDKGLVEWAGLHESQWVNRGAVLAIIEGTP